MAAHAIKRTGRIMSFPLLAANEEPPRSRAPQPSFSNAAETRSDFDVRPLTSRRS